MLAVAAAVALGGCSLAGESNGDKRFSDKAVPFTFELPAEFTKADVDEYDSAGDVVAGAGVDKLDVVAVRRLPAGAEVPRGNVAHRVRGVAVTSRLHRVGVGGDWAIECQWKHGHRKQVLDACALAVATVAKK